MQFTLKTGKVIECGELTAADTLKLTDYLGDSTSGLKVAMIFAIGAMKTIDGLAVTPLSSKVAFDGVAVRLTSNEGLELAQLYNEQAAPVSGDDLKNE